MSNNKFLKKMKNKVTISDTNFLKKTQMNDVTVDIVILTIENNFLKVLLTNRILTPFKNHLTLPGGFIDIKLDLEKNVEEILRRDTGLDNVYLEQLYTFGDINRDPRKRIISISYFALINSKERKITENKIKFNNIGWFDLNDLNNLKIGFDHKNMIKLAIQRIKNKIEYTNICFQLLDKEFTLKDLQESYEIILGRKLDKRNFSKKIYSLDILKDLKKERKKGKMRPAKLYSFKNNKEVFKSGKIVLTR